MWAQVVNMVLGLLVMITPALGAYSQTISNSNYIVGPFVITFAMVAITDAARNVRLFNIPAALWIMVSALLFDAGETARILNMLLGIFIIIFSLMKGQIQQKVGGGWRSLFQDHPKHVQAAKEK